MLFRSEQFHGFYPDCLSLCPIYFLGSMLHCCETVACNNYRAVCMLSGIYFRTKKCRNGDSELFFIAKLGLWVVCNSASTNCRIVFKLNKVLNYHIGMCILSGFMLGQKTTKMTCLTKLFFSITWSCVLSNNTFSITCWNCMSLNGMLNYYTGMHILSGMYFFK